MKAALLFISFFLFGYAQAKNDLEKQNLKGRVKTVTHCQFPVNHGWVDTGWSTIYVFKYDEQGKQVEDEDYTGGSMLTGFKKLNHKRVYSYDANGNQTEVNEYNADGTLSQKVMYEYDGDGRRKVRSNYTPDGKLWRRSVFKYNDRGLESGCSKYTGDSVLLQEFTYRYDEKGNMVEELLFVHRFNDSTDKGAIFNPGDPSKTVRMDYVKIFTYDDSGRKVREVNNIYGASFPFTTDFRYEQYDTTGNWLREELIEGGKPTAIIERLIDYYQ